MHQSKRCKKNHDRIPHLACFTCGRSGSFWIARMNSHKGSHDNLLLVPSCSRCLKNDDEMVYDPLGHGTIRNPIGNRVSEEDANTASVMKNTTPRSVSAPWNVRPILVKPTLNLSFPLQQCLNRVFGKKMVDAIVDQRMYGTWQRNDQQDHLTVRVSPISCVKNLKAVGMWSLTEQGKMKQVELLRGQIEIGSTAQIHWLNEDTIFVEAGSSEKKPQTLNIGKHGGIRAQSFGLYVRALNGTCSFSLDCWNGEDVRMVAFQNPQRSDEWIIGCDAGHNETQAHTFSHPILEISGMLPESPMPKSSKSRFLQYQGELVP